MPEWLLPGAERDGGLGGQPGRVEGQVHRDLDALELAGGVRLSLAELCLHLAREIDKAENSGEGQTTTGQARELRQTLMVLARQRDDALTGHAAVLAALREQTGVCAGCAAPLGDAPQP